MAGRTRGFVQHRQLEQSIDVALFLVATHVQVIMPLETVRELVDEPRIAVRSYHEVFAPDNWTKG